MKGTITWGMPAQIADSKEGFHCGRCGTRRGVYGRDFGIGPDGNPVALVSSRAFDITLTKTFIAAKCWNCNFSYFQKFRIIKITIKKNGKKTTNRRRK